MQRILLKKGLLIRAIAGVYFVCLFVLKKKTKVSFICYSLVVYYQHDVRRNRCATEVPLRVFDISVVLFHAN